MPDQTLSLREAAARLGVHYMTAYRYVRTGRLPAVKRGSMWEVDERDLEAARPQPGPTKGRRRRHDYHLRLEDRLLAGDEQGAWSILESALTAGIEPVELHLEVVAPALERVGAGWESGSLTVADEHRASVVVLRVIGRLGPRFVRRGRKRGTVVLGAPEGDRHGIPVALAADLLRAEGFAVVDLGADTPRRSFIDAARAADGLVGVGISATRSGNERRIRQTVRAVHEEVGCPIVVGGRALLQPLAGAPLGADEVSTSAADLLAAFDRLAATRGRGRPSPSPSV